VSSIRFVLLDLDVGRAAAHCARHWGASSPGLADIRLVAKTVLTETFGKAMSPRPWCFRGHDGMGRLCLAGYSEAGEEDLKAAASSAEGSLSGAVVADTVKARTVSLPERQMEISFETTACVTKRTSKTDRSSRIERDPWKGAKDDEAGRRACYAETMAGWLSPHLSGVEVSVVQWRNYEFVRRGEDRLPSGARNPLPVALFRGTATVRDEASFLGLLRDGVGRAKAYGCGAMLFKRLS
jgi:hypothetical protein